jgi:hypothetical protein
MANEKNKQWRIETDSDPNGITNIYDDHDMLVAMVAPGPNRDRLAQQVAALPVIERWIRAAAMACKYFECGSARENIEMALQAFGDEQPMPAATPPIDETRVALQTLADLVEEGGVAGAKFYVQTLLQRGMIGGRR